MDDIYSEWGPAPGDRVEVPGAGRTGTIKRVRQAGDQTLCEVEYDFAVNSLNREAERRWHPMSELRPIDQTAIEAIRKRDLK